MILPPLTPSDRQMFETLRLLEQAQIPVKMLGQGFVAYHLRTGKTPQEIVQIAVGKPAQTERITQ